MDILNKVVGAVTGGGGNPLMNMVMGMISGGSGPGNGLAGLMQKFQGNGLGDMMQSWVGKGDNQAVSADQITQAFGQEEMANMAQQTGMEQNDLASKLSEILPQAVNQATPDGEAPSGAFDMGNLTSMLGGLFKQ